MQRHREFLAESVLAEAPSTASAARRSALLVVIGFAALILIGTLLLMLPFATAVGSPPPLGVALFTATSAVCVTGLVVVDTGSYWSPFGQGVILVLIELGGVGFGASATFLFWLVGRNISMSDRLALTGIFPGATRHQIRRMALFVVTTSLALQVLGALWLFWQWAGRFPVDIAASLAVFHSISAFCNAGFDIFGSVGDPGIGLEFERHSGFITFPIVLLVLVGGLGFPVLSELLSWRPRWTRRRWSRASIFEGAAVRPPLSLHARLVLLAHLGLFTITVIVLWLIELDNPATLQGQPFGQQLVDVINAAAHPRTAGFATIPPVAFSPSSLLLILVLMFIGTASAGTGGGVKVNTVAALVASVFATVAGRPRPELFKRSLTQESVNKALALVLIAPVVIVSAIFVLSLTDSDLRLETLLFEVVSAFSTVGLSMGVTPELSEAGRVVIELLMFIGRLGPMTLIVLLTAGEHPVRVSYPEEPVLVG